MFAAPNIARRPPHRRPPRPFPATAATGAAPAPPEPVRRAGVPRPDPRVPDPGTGVPPSLPTLPSARHGARALLLALLALTAPLAAPGVAPAAETQLYLSWGAPHGAPGARDTLARPCGDSTRVDTLYLSFEAGEDFKSLVAISGEIELTPVYGDTLPAYWSFRSEAWTPGSYRAEFAGAGRTGCPFPWTSAGMPVLGFAKRDGIGVLRFLYAVPITQPATVRTGERYCLARILMRHRAWDDPGCHESLRVTWSEGEFADYPGTERRVLTGRQRPIILRIP